jgi:hypothetical protein
MTKPFDFSDLELRLKTAGLPVVANLATLTAQNVFSWLQDSLALEAQANPLFAIGVPVLAALQPAIMGELAKVLPAAPAATPAP